MKRPVDMRTSPRGCIEPEVGSRLAAFEWGLLTPGEEQTFEAHVVSCPACAAELASLPRMGAAMCARPRRTRRFLLPLGAAAAAVAVVAFSNLLGSPRRELAAGTPLNDSVASPARQATMTFELQIPAQSSFTYDLTVPGTS